MFWLDWVIIAVVLFGIWRGFWRGFVWQLFQIGSLVAAFLLTFWLFPQVGGWFETQLKLPVSYARPLSLALLFILLSLGLQFVGGILHKLFAPILTANPMNRLAGAIVGGFQHLLFLSIILALMVTLPLPAGIKKQASESRLAKPLITLALSLERQLGGMLGGRNLPSFGYRTVGTTDRTTTSLNFTEANPTEDIESELKLAALVNHYRQNEKLPVLVPHQKLQAAAVAHAKDMLAKGYFSHISPQNKDALARVQETGLVVVSVGENLAHAPTVEIAHAGLLASKGHRENIITKTYTHMGVAVLDAGKHGKMIVQVFAQLP